jgi:hypothetical protein
MNALTGAEHYAPVRVLPHIKRLDDCFGDFLVRVTCPAGIAPHRVRTACADRRKVGDARETRGKHALLELWEESRGGGRGYEAEAARSA